VGPGRVDLTCVVDGRPWGVRTMTAEVRPADGRRRSRQQLARRSRSTDLETLPSGGEVAGAGCEAVAAPDRRSSVGVFLVRVVVIHLVSYLAAGAVFSALLDYQRLFQQPVIRDYMLPFGSTSLLLSLGLQVVRGAVLGLVLLPFRAVLAATRSGWVQLWALMVGIGIVSTPAAAPSSIEAVIYTRLPLWYHALGLPEMLSQTLVFSWLVHLYLRHPEGLVRALPGSFAVLVRAVVGACVAFLGYAVFSVTFALASGLTVSSGQNLSLRTQGMFVVVFVANALVLLAHLHTGTAPASHRRRFLVGVAVYLSNALLIAVYQAVVLGGVGPAYPLLAPLLPAVLVTLTTPRDRAGARATLDRERR
jgi:hypothetical protein